MRRWIGGMVSLSMALTPWGAATPADTGFMSSNVTYVTTVPYEAAGLPSGARVVGKYLYLAGARSLSIYDISDPLDPQLQSITAIGPVFPNEDVDTNGKVLLVTSETIGKKLLIYDVEDKGAPVKLAEVEPVRDHTFSCVLKCRYAYGSRGTIVDLKDPADPKLTGSWGGGTTPGDGYDVTEVVPGLVLTATRTIRLLDARKDPLHPTTLAMGGTVDNRLIHSNRWPRGGRDRFFLVQGETPFSQTCNEDSGAFMTWDASKWRKTHSFTLIDEFRVENGTYVDGNPPAGVFGCTNMWFQEHPRFRNGGLVAAAFFEHGTRFLEVDPRGRIEQVGYFTPVGGATIASYWITPEVVYAVDEQRGIDILRFEG
jgi:hypothetical protein